MHNDAMRERNDAAAGALHIVSGILDRIEHRLCMLEVKGQSPQ
jgi:hypothetical protein